MLNVDTPIFDLESGVRVTRDSVPILVFLGLSVPDLGPMYATDVRRQTDRRQTASSLNAPAKGRGHNNTHKVLIVDWLTYVQNILHPSFAGCLDVVCPRQFSTIPKP